VLTRQSHPITTTSLQSTMHCTLFRFCANVEESLGIWIEFSGPFFFNETLNADRHLHMLQNNIVPQLMATQGPLDTQWIMQDDATPHNANKVLDFLHNTSGARVISHSYPDRHNCSHFSPPLSPDLNTCDFYSFLRFPKG
jgi:hypothetical protein